MWGKRRKAKRTRAWGFKSAVKEALSKRRLATRKKSVARVTRLKPRNVKRHLRPPSKNGSRNMREEKRDWEIGESNPFSKTPIERWEADICATKLSRQLEEEGCNATCEERSGQAEYSGFGDSALEQASSYYRARGLAWQKSHAGLEELVSDEQLREIRRSRISAFHTTLEIVRAIWKGLWDMGVDIPDSLNDPDPSAGSGRPMGLQPSDTAMKSKRGAAELDPMTTGILKHPYVETKVYAAGIQKEPIPDNHFDIAISNVPFGKVKVYDPEFNESGRKFLTGSFNNYYVDNPHRVLGKHSAAGSMYRGREYTVKSDPSIPVVPTLNREMREMAENLGPPMPSAPEEPFLTSGPKTSQRPRESGNRKAWCLRMDSYACPTGHPPASQTCRPRTFNG